MGVEEAVNLYPYQVRGRDFLAQHKRAYLADDMGLGKSAQAITAAARVWDSGRIVVVCPASAAPNWEHEWDLWDGPGEPLIVSYATLIRRNWKKMKPEIVILDEAHYVKSPSSKRTRAALGLARKAEYAWLLSGTPMPNDPTELWPPVKYLWPEMAEEHGCRTAVQWMNTFCKTRPTLYGPKPYAVRNGAALRSSLDGIMLRRKLDDVGLELPPLRRDLVRLPKTAAAAKALSEYEGLEADEAAYTSTLRRVLGELKAPLVAKQIREELDDGAYEKIVVLYYHRAVGRELKKQLAPYGVAGFDGSTSQNTRAQEIEIFQAYPFVRVFLAQQTAAGIAINLTAAREVVLVEPAWSPEDNEQAIKRVHRIGQDAPCRARTFCITGTLDEAIMGTIHMKKKMQKEVGLG